MSAISNWHPAVTEILEALGLRGKKVTNVSLHIDVDDLVIMHTRSFVTDDQMEAMAEVFRKYRITTESEPVQESVYPKFVTEDQVDLFNELIRGELNNT